MIKLKKLLFLTVSVFILSALIYKAYATNGQGTGSQGSTGRGTQESTTQPVQNQNKVQVKNQGEEQQLQVQTQEQQDTETEEGTNSNSQGAKKGLSETRSFVAQQIQALLQTQSAAGGIGDQVREWARAQQQSELKIQEHLSKIEGKTGLARSLFGPNYGSLNELKQEVNQNRVRVQQLEQLKSKLTDQSDIANVDEMITLLNQENTALQEKINLEETNGGLLGWLVKLFVK